MQSLLIDIDQEMPMPADELVGAFHSAAGHHRESDIVKLLSQIDAKTAQLDPLRIATAASNLVDWNRQLKQLSQDFPIRKQILGPRDRLDEKWKAEGTFLDDPEIRDLVSTDLARMAAVRQLATASRSQLIDVAQNGEPVEVALEAYRLLGAPNIDPPWPTGATELSTDHDMRARLEKSLASISNADERTAPLQMLHEEAPERWKRVVEHARETQTLAAAWTLRQQFAIDDGQLDTLAP